LTACTAPTRAVASTSPFPTSSASTASIVDGVSRISPRATARRLVSGLSPTSTILTSPDASV